MIISTYLTCIIFLLIEFKVSHSKEIGIKVGDKLNICCTLKVLDKNPLFMWKGSIRLASLYEKKINPGDWNLFEKIYKDFKIEEKDNTICITKEKVSKDDGNLDLKCSVTDGFFGQTIQSEDFSVKVFEELIFTVIINEITKTSVGDTLLIECGASGYPDLKVLWRKQSQGVMSEGTNTATLTINEVTAAMHGDKYTCEASISVPNNMINKTTKLDVQFKPEIDVVLKPLHTDIGVQEEVDITVRGNPQPKIDCQLLNIPTNRVITISEPSPTTYVYKMTFSNITQNEIGSYKCTATNDKGEAEKIVSLILGPINLRITSTNDTAYANYYLLKWQVESKAKIHLSKIEIDEYAAGIDSKITKRILEGPSLSPITDSAGNKANNWLFEFSHHILNLTANKLYKISLTMCRRDQCIEAEKELYLKTPQFNGNNNIDLGKLTSNQYLADNPNKERPIHGVSIFIVAVNLVLFSVINRL